MLLETKEVFNFLNFKSIFLNEILPILFYGQYKYLLSKL
jgi:hypothetical protein